MTFERSIASQAQTLVSAVVTRPNKEPSEYRAFSESFPVLLRTAGLAQTVAFLHAKDEHPRNLIRQHLEDQFRKMQLLPSNASLLDLAIKSSAADYRLYSQIALRIAFWHKRMAQALLPKGKAAR